MVLLPCVAPSLGWLRYADSLMFVVVEPYAVLRRDVSSETEHPSKHVFTTTFNWCRVRYTRAPCSNKR